MRSSRPCALFAMSLLSFACSNKSQEVTPSPSASPSSSAPIAEIPDAPPSPFSVALESPKPLVFTGIGAGVAIANEARTHLATQMAGAEMVLGIMPEGLPEGKVVRFDGRLPGSLWLSFETPAEEKGKPKNPLFRLDTRKNAWKKWTDDWKPLLAPWSNHRILSMSTSSGKLKIKVVEPYRDKPDATWPSAHLNDETCEKSLKLDGLTTLPAGDVFAAGHCKAGGSNRKYVLVRWPVSQEPAAGAPSASAAPPPVAPTITPSASASAAPEHEPPSADAPDAGAADAGEPVAVDIGIHGEVLIVPETPSPLEHREIVAHGEKDVYVLATERGGAAHVFRYDGSAISAEVLPKELTGEVRGIAPADDGTLWLVSTSEIWKRPSAGEWEKVAPPSGHWREAGPKWEMTGAWAAKGDVWIAGKHASASGEHYVVLRLRAVKETVKMP